MDIETNERYDRQIRLWGQHGQSKCSNSKICLINANSLGTEILKGLCLAGIGSFTILDSHKLAPEDVGCNFIPQSCIAKSRGESVKNMLLDLNEEISVDVYSLETYLPREDPTDREPGGFKWDSNFWKQFNCVISSGVLYKEQIQKVSRICEREDVPLILCKSIGYFGSMKIQLNQHIVVEPHSDNFLPDFRLDVPFTELKKYLDSTEQEDISHHPYIAVLYKYLKIWQKKNCAPPKTLPGNYSEKYALQSLIDRGLNAIHKEKNSQSKELINNQSLPDQGIPYENYLEASKAVNSCLTYSCHIPESVDTLFKRCRLRNTPRNSTFWAIIRAIKEFAQGNKMVLPLNGTIPDMSSSSKEYIRLQTIYAKKAQEDLDTVFHILRNYLSIKLPSGCLPDSSLYDETKIICKNIRSLQVLQTVPVHYEYQFHTLVLSQEFEEDEHVTIDICLKALDLFFARHGRLPGCHDDQVEPDIRNLKYNVMDLVGRPILDKLKSLDQCVYEISRCGGAELHATSAFLGGCVSQEVIKLITNQYIPVDDTLVYNAKSASTKTYKFKDVMKDTCSRPSRHKT